MTDRYPLVAGAFEEAVHLPACRACYESLVKPMIDVCVCVVYALRFELNHPERFFLRPVVGKRQLRLSARADHLATHTAHTISTGYTSGISTA